RLSVVRRALYLLFNEGYHGASAESAVRVELCREAIRLTVLLLDYPPAATPETHALAALMCLHAARIPARIDASGGPTALLDRDRLVRYPFYPAAMGELELRRGNRDAARAHFSAALALARNATERRFLTKRLDTCNLS